MLIKAILLSMFIAVIQENFEVPEEEKRRHQVRTYIEKTVPLLTSRPNQTNMSFTALLARFKKSTNEETEFTALNMLMKEAVVHDFLDERSRSRNAGILQIQN
ncbi:hypothetical protein NEOLI_005237 [Neolecta irregularis DAH-3]|uniref:Uncharacterized protein n=1 Tax=Neolecta irregularis (strain DAH-3) TaxID=1198029 RepID=A0A1U7LN25_NEOID|nr:hypothetical protein NEOLI_005237 [Neolecta irregularis DAH-3]|eukprot:OLL24054.1 hypothetical protein NEOLI_005237 [Neolecta irregularis DAH-3]